MALPCSAIATLLTLAEETASGGNLRERECVCVCEAERERGVRNRKRECASKCGPSLRSVRGKSVCESVCVVWWCVYVRIEVVYSYLHGCRWTHSFGTVQEGPRTIKNQGCQIFFQYVGVLGLSKKLFRYLGVSNSYSLQLWQPVK